METCFSGGQDTQVHFMLPDGKLHVPGAENLIPPLARFTNWALQDNVLVVASADAHLPTDEEFSQYPPHCLAGTQGQLRLRETSLTPQFTITNRPGAELANIGSRDREAIIRRVQGSQY